MWVHADDVDVALRLSREAKVECGYHLVSRYGDATAEKLCFLREDDGIQFDLFRGAVYYRNRMLISGDAVMLHTRDYRGVRVMDDDFADLVAFLKEILNNGQCSAKYVSPILGSEVFTEDYLRENLRAFGSDFVRRLHLFISNRKTDDFAIFQLAHEARLALSSPIDVSFYAATWHKVQRLFCRPGYVIAFSEQTEAQTIEAIAERLEGAFHHGVKVCTGRPSAKQVLQTFYKAKVLLVNQSAYRRWWLPRPDLVVPASFSAEMAMQRIVQRMARRFE